VCGEREALMSTFVVAFFQYFTYNLEDGDTNIKKYKILTIYVMAIVMFCGAV
jgi:hypothetical protein